MHRALYLTCKLRLYLCHAQEVLSISLNTVTHFARATEKKKMIGRRNRGGGDGKEGEIKTRRNRSRQIRSFCLLRHCGGTPKWWVSLDNPYSNSALTSEELLIVGQGLGIHTREGLYVLGKDCWVSRTLTFRCKPPPSQHSPCHEWVIAGWVEEGHNTNWTDVQRMPRVIGIKSRIKSTLRWREDV